MATAIPRDGLGNLRVLKLVHTAAVAVGDVIVSGGNVLIAVNAADADAENLYIYRGRAEFPKGAGAIAAVAQVYWDPSAGQVTTGKGMAAGSPAAGSNTGDGTVTGVSVGSNAIAETWTLKCITAAANAGTFSVIGSKTGRMEDAEVGAAYDNGFLALTINDGATDFIVGDTFTIAVTQANTQCGVTVEAAADADTEAQVMLHEN